MAKRRGCSRRYYQRMASRFLSVSVRVAVAGLAALLCGETLGGQTPPAPPLQSLGTGLIIGQVVDAESGRPVGESIVTLVGNAGQSVNPITAMAAAHKVITDSSGRFVYRDLGSARVAIRDGERTVQDLMIR